MAQNKSYKELMELQGQSGGTQQGAGAGTSNQMLDLILGRKPFSYNAQTDPAAQAARKTAARNAQAVTRDTLGQHAPMTGGVPSTAAVSAAAQAGNNAMQQGADRVAELEQLAFQNYRAEGQDMYNAYAAMQGAEGDAWSRSVQEQQLQYQKEQDEYQKKLALAQLAAAYGDYSGLKALGINTSNYSAGGSGGGGGSYRGSGGGSGGGSGSGGGGNGQTGLPADTVNDLLLAYGKTLPESVWAQYAAQYGESALKARGFTKQRKSPSTRSGAPVRETIGGSAKPEISPT